MIITEKTSNAVSRRTLLTGGLAGGFLLAFHLPVRAANEPVQPPDVTDGKFAPNAFIRIDDAGRTTLVMLQVEMGQGIYTAVAMILAEELDADLSQLALEHAPPNDKLYGNPTFGLQVTGNSNSIRAFWKPLRNAGASARAMLVQAAATEWKVEPASCTTSKGQVTHTESGRNLSYGELATAASSETPAQPALVDERISPSEGISIGSSEPPRVINRRRHAPKSKKVATAALAKSKPKATDIKRTTISERSKGASDTEPCRLSAFGGLRKALNSVDCEI